MKKLLLLGIAILFVSFLSVPFLHGCEFDTDCEPGSKCVKPGGSIYGACFGGISPGNKNDEQPVYDPLDVNGTYGDTCEFDVDCGPGSVCVKGRGSITGTCVRRR